MHGGAPVALRSRAGLVLALLNDPALAVFDKLRPPMVGREALFAIGLVGRALVRPGQALRAVEERARGGTRAAAFLVLVAIPLSRASNLLPRVWDVDWGSAAAQRLFLTMLAEVAIALALALGVLLVVRSRVDYDRRRPKRDVQLAATCCLPALLVRLVAGLFPCPCPHGKYSSPGWPSRSAGPWH